MTIVEQQTSAVPDLATGLPGAGAAHRAARSDRPRDHRARRGRHQPVADPRVPARRAARPRLRARGRRRQPLPRLQRRHRRRRRRPRPPGGQRGDPRPGRRRPALLLERLLPAGLRRRVRAARRPGADAATPRVFLVQLGHRGRRGRPQARPPPHRPAQRHRLPRRLPRPLARQPVADRQQGPPARRLRHRHARHVPRPVRRSLRPRRADRCGVHRAGAVHDG